MDNLATDDDLARARRDPAFRQQFLIDNLDRLLDALNRTRKTGGVGPAHVRQVREGVDLALKLADRLQHDDLGPAAA